MAWLPPQIQIDRVGDAQYLGLPLLGRELSILMTGASGVLAGQYFFLHGHSDSRLLVWVAITVLVLTFTMAALLMEVSWVAQMMPAAQLRLRFMWEYVAMQPMAGITQALCQGYLIYRYYGLGKTSRQHRLMTAGFVFVCIVETVLHFSLTVMTILAWANLKDRPVVTHQDAATEATRKLWRAVIVDVYTMTLFLATVLNSQLAVWFCWKLWTLRTRDESTTQAIRFVILLALFCGLCTATMTIIWALWFAISKGDSYRLLVDLGPGMYACGFFLSLMSREKIRRGLRASQSERNDKALQPISIVPSTCPILSLDAHLETVDEHEPEDHGIESAQSTEVGHRCSLEANKTVLTNGRTSSSGIEEDELRSLVIIQDRKRNTVYAPKSPARHAPKSPLLSHPIGHVVTSGWRKSRGDQSKGGTGSIVVHSAVQQIIE